MTLRATPEERWAALAEVRARLEPSLREVTAGSDWSYLGLGGRLVALVPSRGAGDAVLSLAFALVLDAQRCAQAVAWVGARSSAFFPPDVAACGVDLEALVVVRVPRAEDVPLAGDWLARSGAFGLIVLDLASLAGEVPPPLQSRLDSLARRHALVVLCLIEKPGRASALGSLVSVRGEARLARCEDGGFRCELVAVKDKRRVTPWRCAWLRHGMPGLC